MAVLKNKSLLLRFCCGLMMATFSLAHYNVASAQTDPKIELEADNLVHDRDAKTVTALGNVRVAHRGYILIADKVILSQNTNSVHAEGHVQITSPKGDVMLMDKAELNETLTAGFIENVRIILNDGSRMAAKNGQLVSDTQANLNRVVFTPCHLCADSDKDPVWQIKAVKVVHDEEKKRIYYTNAVLEIMGVPVIYLPYLSHPDPRVARASGFLVPQISGQRELGVSVSTPYYYVLNDYSDVTFTPTFYSQDRPLLEIEYRQNLEKGALSFTGRGTYTGERNDLNEKTGRDVFRGSIDTDFTYNHKDNWISTLHNSWASDDTFLRRYGYSELDSLITSAKTEAFFGQSYFRITAMSFQGLRLEDDPGQSPIVLPMVDYSYVGKKDDLGGFFKTDINGLMLVRTEGMDTRRISMNSSWERPFVTEMGAQFLFKASVRGDVYNISDAELSPDPQFSGQNGTDGRILPQVSIKMNWPFIQMGQNHHQIIEPIIDIIGAPNQTPSNIIPIEDSRSFELSDTNIYSENRFPGIDRYEGSSRVNYGIKWSMDAGKVSSTLFISQSYRLSNEETLFGKGSGLEGKFSDIVGRMELGVEDLARVIYRFRIDKDDTEFRRHEVDAVFGKGENLFSVGYFKLNRGPDFIGLADREEIRAAAAYEVKTNWTVYGDITRNLTNGDEPIAQRLGLRYRDECLEFSLAWRKTFTSDRDIVPGNSIMFRINLKYLG